MERNIWIQKKTVTLYRFNDELKSKLTGWLLICLLTYLQKNKQNGTENKD